MTPDLQTRYKKNLVHLPNESLLNIYETLIKYKTNPIFMDRTKEIELVQDEILRRMKS